MCCNQQKREEEEEEAIINLKEENSILEKTIADMVGENEIKDKYIAQMRLDEKKFVEDAINNEEELKELINIREKEILKATEKTDELETQLRRYINKETADSGTQTHSSPKKSIGVQTLQVINRHSSSSVQTELTEKDIIDLCQKRYVLDKEVETMCENKKLGNDIRALSLLNEGMVTDDVETNITPSTPYLIIT
ncbi:hypothetical protein JTB14_008169 [Gonioctena quinquepunctata]|nr:hypothetical protein JTB14_008169 [Gonioctena quinquepunctata]